MFVRDWLGDLDGIRTGSVVTDMLVHPGSDSIRLEIVSDAEGVRLRQGYSDENQRSIAPELRILDEDIVSFIQALTLSNRGRTSPTEIYALLQMQLLGRQKKRLWMTSMALSDKYLL